MNTIGGTLKSITVAVLLGLGLTVSGCSSSESNNKAACEEFQYLMNRAFLVGEDIVLDGANYSEDLKNKVIPLADKELTLALLKMLSIMEQTNRGGIDATLGDLKTSNQTLVDSCNAAGVELGNQ
jgi:hypothetical protein